MYILSLVLNRVVKLMEAVVLDRVGFLAYSCPKQGQDFKSSAAPLYPNMAQIPPPPPGFQSFYKLHVSVYTVPFSLISDIMDKSSSTKRLYSDVVKGETCSEPSPTRLRNYQREDEEEAVKKGNRGVGEGNYLFKSENGISLY